MPCNLCKQKLELLNIYLNFVTEKIIEKVFRGYADADDVALESTMGPLLPGERHTVLSESEREIVEAAKKFKRDLLDEAGENIKKLEEYCKSNNIHYPESEQLVELKRHALIHFKEFGKL